MKIMKKIAGAAMLLPFAAAAQLTAPDASVVVPPETGLPTTPSAASGIVITYVKWLVGMFWVIVVLFAVYAAFKYLTAQGDEKKLATAKKMVIYTVIAAAIALLGTVIRQVASGLLKAT